MELALKIFLTVMALLPFAMGFVKLFKEWKELKKHKIALSLIEFEKALGYFFTGLMISLVCSATVIFLVKLWS